MIANHWHKSTRSGAAGHCVQAFWQKSTRSNPSGNCVEAKTKDDTVLVRDTKLGDGSPILTFTEQEWLTFIGEIKANITCPVVGDFEVWLMACGFDLVEREGAVLSFTNEEWEAFVGGVRDGEFDLQPA